MKINRFTQYLLLLAALFVSGAFITPIMYGFPDERFPIFYFLLKSVLIILTILTLIKMLITYIRNIANKKYSGIIAIAVLFGVLFCIVELFFTFFAQTNGINDTYCSKYWKYKYWKENEDGFRDVDFRDLTQELKPIIAFVGDSYTEGHGIKHVEDRVSNIIRRQFTNYTIFNLGKCGWNIFEEIEIINNMPIQPKYIFLQICSNDWEYLQKELHANNNKNNLLLATAEEHIKLSNYSVFLNYMNANLQTILSKLTIQSLSRDRKAGMIQSFKLPKQHQDIPNDVIAGLNYCLKYSSIEEKEKSHLILSIVNKFDKNLAVMNDSVLFSNYTQQLNYIDSVCNSKSIKLVVVPYPNFDEFSLTVTGNYTHEKLVAILNHQQLETINIFPALQASGIKDFTVNRYDAHLNEEGSKIVANVIADYLKKHP